jgi:hypothetical protein
VYADRVEVRTMHLTKVSTQEVRYEQVAGLGLEGGLLTTTLVIETRGGEKLKIKKLSLDVCCQVHAHTSLILP